MSTKTKSEIVSRIKACLKYADPKFNSNEHERIAAKKAAQTLIAKHGITARDLGVVSEAWIVNVTFSESENLSSVFESLKKSGVKPKRGWREDGP